VHVSSIAQTFGRTGINDLDTFIDDDACTFAREPCKLDDSRTEKCQKRCFGGRWP